MGFVLQVLLVAIGFGSILFLAYITTRYIAVKSNMAMRGRYINVVETVSLGMDKRLHLVKIGSQFILIASSAKSIEFLTTVSLDDFDAAEEVKDSPVFDFKAIFDKYIQNYKNKKNDKNDEAGNSKDLGNKVNDSSFRSNLNKLRAITKRLEGQHLKDKDDITDEK